MFRLVELDLLPALLDLEAIISRGSAGGQMQCYEVIRSFDWYIYTLRTGAKKKQPLDLDARGVNGVGVATRLFPSVSAKAPMMPRDISLYLVTYLQFRCN
jgi:hypothetical protein